MYTRFKAICVTCSIMAVAGFNTTQAQTITFAEFDNDIQGWRVSEHSIELMWSGDDAGGGMGSVNFFIDPDQPDDDSPEGKVEGDLPEGVNISDYEYASFYYKCDSEDYTGSSLFMMPMLEGGAGGGGSHHSGSMIGDNEWHYQEFHMSEFSLWWGDWTWENTQTLVIGFTETNERGFCELRIDHVMLHNGEGDGMILAAGGTPKIISTNPAENAEVSRLNEVTFAFNQEVQGVSEDGSDLLVNGAPASVVTTSNNRTYVFSGFQQPSEDTAEINLLAGSIESLSGDAFEGYSYTINLYEARSYDAPFASIAPEFDGIINDGEYAGIWINDWKDNLGIQDPESDIDWNVEWTATHTTEYVYAAFRAQDDVRETHADPWAQDNVEFFIDAENAKEGTGLQFRTNWDGTSWVTSANENWEFMVNDTGAEWMVEARFNKASLSIPAEGIIGFNIQPSDNDDGTRGTYHFWEDSPVNNNPWNDASAWGNIVLQASPSDVINWNLY